MKYYNLRADELIELSLQNKESRLTKRGAIAVTTGKKTGRSPNDRFIVQDDITKDSVNWGKVNQAFCPEKYQKLHQKLHNYFEESTQYVAHLHVGWHHDHYIPLEVVTDSAWHSLFAENMFIRPKKYNHNDVAQWRIYNATKLCCDPEIDGTNSDGAVIINFSKKEIILIGMRYAGEMKKSIFSVMNYILPEYDILPMHCAANVGEAGDATVFFGLSGTGKTTLSADPTRHLIGDDEHGWGDSVLFNIEGGCYAKTYKLSSNEEPVIWNAIRRGAIVENVVVDEEGEIDFDSSHYSENGRCSFPLEHVEKRVEQGFHNEPNAVIFLTCDLTGVLPPVAILDKYAAAYHFVSGYTARMGSTEGLGSEVLPVFSACFGAPFMPRHEKVYAELLMKNMERTNAKVYLINTGWVGGSLMLGTGNRYAIETTRKIVALCQADAFADIEKITLPGLNLTIPAFLPQISGVNPNPKLSWQDAKAYDEQLVQLVKQFKDNALKLDLSEEILNSGPHFDQ